MIGQYRINIAYAAPGCLELLLYSAVGELWEGSSMDRQGRLYPMRCGWPLTAGLSCPTYNALRYSASNWVLNRGSTAPPLFDCSIRTCVGSINGCKLFTSQAEQEICNLDAADFSMTRIYRQFILLSGILKDQAENCNNL